MGKVYYNNDPSVADTVVFDLLTTDTSGAALDAYKVNKVVIYFIERGATAENINQYTRTVGANVYTEYFKEAVPVATFGSQDYPAWIGTDPDHAWLTHVTEDDNGGPLIGVFRLEWTPELQKEGTYVLCYEWTPILGADTLNETIDFSLSATTRSATSIPSHLTVPEKYEVLLDRYLPEMFELMIGDDDLTPDILNRMNKAVAKGFTQSEDQANQIVDLLDANAVPDYLLPYLGNLFGIDLRSQDATLWRKQIKRAIPLAKKKGTIGGLTESLANADVQFKKLTRLWQVVSPSTWQDGFVITQEQVDAGTITFTLSKLATLPVDPDNFEVYYRQAGTGDYTPLTADYVILENEAPDPACGQTYPAGVTTATWDGESQSPAVALAAGDVVRIVYKVAAVDNQTVENYIRTLPLADLRDEVDVTYPLKNWNVRVIAEDDPLFDLVVPERHPFHYPVVFGKIRTEFPYSENIYNMDEYNGSTRDSTDPCHLDKTFVDSCSACLSSKFSIDVEVEDMSNDRVDEVARIIKDFVPFHAVVHTINYTGSKNEFMQSPLEHIECLSTVNQVDNVIATQMSFNRLVEEGASNALEIKRNMLASTAASSHTGTGANQAITLFSPGINFKTLGVDTEGDTYLEILSGTDAGEYKVDNAQRYTVDIVQGQPDTIGWPVDTSGFPFRLSNVIYDGTADIVKQNVFKFQDDAVRFVDYGVTGGFKIVVTTGPNAGTYTVSDINPDNTLTLSSFATTSTVTGLHYEIRTAGNSLRYTGTTGKASTSSVGKITLDVDAGEFGVQPGYYVKYNGTQFRVIGVDSDVYVSDFTGSTASGQTIQVYDRILDNAIGYLDVRGMVLTGTVPTVSYATESDTFLENYLILIGTDYYQIGGIDGSDMVLNGPMLSWGLSGTSVNYLIVHFTKTPDVVTQGGENPFGSETFDRIDRRGNDEIVVRTETILPMAARAAILNDANDGVQTDAVSQQEHIWFNIEYKE